MSKRSKFLWKLNGLLLRLRGTTREEFHPDSVFAALSKGKCPDCASAEFLMGPRGGAAQNVKCAGCGSEFNLAPFEDGKWLGEPLFAERISEARKNAAEGRVSR